ASPPPPLPYTTLFRSLPDGKVRVIAPIDDTPAARAGVKAGDTIIAVDGMPLTPASAAGQGPLRGKSGSTVELTIAREGESKPLRSEEHTSELQSRENL